MLIHIGANEFVGMNKCELMVNLQTIDEDSKKRILAVLPKLSEKEEYKSAILTTHFLTHCLLNKIILLLC